MPFSFIDIEEKKTKLIGFVFFFIILFYFATIYLLFVVLNNTLLGHRTFAWPSGPATLVVLGVAFLIALIHWTTSTSHLIEKLSLSAGATELDPKDIYHKNLRNIIDEVSVAIGGRQIQGMVIPSVSLNAFALEDFTGRAVIGVTEGLLMRLNRSQLEAVIGHEAGHIVNGDCLSTSVTCALAELYDEVFSRLKVGLRQSRGRGGALILLFFLVVFFMRFLSTFLRYFISRQKEYRADATSVRLTRNPLSLAEALSLIATNWRGAGANGDHLESIFIVNPNFSRIDEKEGLFADMFSTHPPLKERIRILADMAHCDTETLEARLKGHRWVSPVAKAEFREQPAQQPAAWHVFVDQKWQGPFGLDELMGLTGLNPETWVRPEGTQSVFHAYEDRAINVRFSKKEPQEKDCSCPHCRVPLSEYYYEGVPVHKCSYCEGVFVSSRRMPRILFRRDKVLDADVVRLAETAIKERGARLDGSNRQKGVNAWVLDCPQCKRKMRRQFFVYSYPVEIDRCFYCEGVWLDRHELEVLQYIYENKEQFFDNSSF